jgi:hypothetical protein
VSSVRHANSPPQSEMAFGVGDDFLLNVEINDHAARAQELS